MGMAIFIENQIHERVGSVFDDAQDSFMRICDAGPRGSVRRDIMRHGDTMLNTIQLERLIEELDGLPPEQRSNTVRQVQNAAHDAIRLRGYLIFAGD